MRLDILAVAAALLLWIGGGSWYWVCKVKEHCDELPGKTTEVVEAPVTPEAPSMAGFHVGIAGEKLFLRMDPLLSKAGSSDLAMTPSLESALDSLTVYFGNNDGSYLEIIGNYFDGMEGEDSQLALERAKGLGRILIQKGMDPARLVYSYDGTTVISLADSMVNAVSVNILASEEENEASLAALFDPNNQYFDFGVTNLPVTPEFRTYCNKVIRYLRSHPEASLSVTGHTDNVGSPARNKEVGLGRAQTVSDVLAGFGVSTEQMNVSSEGMGRPIADNNTEEGRAKNRRVEIRLVAGAE